MTVISLCTFNYIVQDLKITDCTFIFYSGEIINNTLTAIEKVEK